MDIRTLQYFLAVAREGSITRAAESLHMTQPPLTRQLQELETELGKQLLIRGNRKISLTNEGEILRKRAEEILELMEKTKSEITASDEFVSGEVLIGSGETEAISILAQAASALKQPYPQIGYRIYSGDAAHVMEKLDKGLLDFGLLVEPVDITKYHYLRLPFKDTWGILMKKDDPLAVKESVRPEDLYGKPMIVSHQMKESSELAAWFQTDISKLRVALYYDLIYNASHFVRQGFGYAIALDKLVNTQGTDLCFLPLSPKLEAGLCIVWKKHQVFSKAADKFLQELQGGFPA